MASDDGGHGTQLRVELPLRGPHSYRAVENNPPYGGRFKPRFRRHASPQGYSPRQIAARLKFPTAVTGKGVTIGFVELGGGYSFLVLNTYFGPAWRGSVTALPVQGATNNPGADTGADTEVMLDLCVAGALAPGARLAVAFAPNSDAGFAAAVRALLAAGCDVISISWGGPEDNWGTNYQSLQAAFAACAAAGVAVFAAAGDNGSGDGEPGDHADYPGSDPNVISCGGTRVADPVDTVWNDGTRGGATGGGFSSLFAMPAWQRAALAQFAGRGRGVPDVAGPADPQTGWTVVDTGGNPIVVGGTSAVVPMWAALWALLTETNGGKRLPPPGPWLYGLQDKGCFTDVQVGNNGSYAAGVGWDACTGLGEPAGAALAAALSGGSSPPPPPPPPPPASGPTATAVGHAVVTALARLPTLRDRLGHPYVGQAAAEQAAVVAVDAAFQTDAR